jgi:uncharacterized membrane protein YfcA
MLFRFSLYGFLKNQRYFEPFLVLAFLEKGLSFFEIGLLITLGILLWFPFCFYILEIQPLELLQQAQSWAAAVMFFCGAVIANSTAVGGGIIFNPTLQIAFGVSGFSALTLSIIVQCTGMTSGTYGWFKKDQYRSVPKEHIRTIITVVALSSLAFSALFIWSIRLFPDWLPATMKIASMLISFYVFRLVWNEISNRESHIQKLEQSAENGDVANLIREAHILNQTDHPQDEETPMHMDRRIIPWLVLGSLLNIYTAVGAGELLFSHLIKYYKVPAKTAVALGTLAQMIAVLIQCVFLIIFMQEFIIIPLVSIGLLFCLIGGRMAPYILTRPFIEPFVKHILAFTALGMGITSGAMILANFLSA